ncbi:Uncharacterised protein [uncultured archaeon]|nr:Uncharacterised protein [uncultured archaeon]
MKNVYLLSIAALFVFGLLFFTGTQGATGLAGPIKHGYGYYTPYGTAIARPDIMPERTIVQEPVVYVGRDTLTTQDCILGRELYNARTLQNVQIGAPLEELISACDDKGW